MRVGQLRTIMEGRSDSELVFSAWYDIHEANDIIANEIHEGAKPFTHEEWIFIYTSMIEDDGIWQEINQSFQYYINSVMEQRAKGNADVNSE